MDETLEEEKRAQTYLVVVFHRALINNYITYWETTKKKCNLSRIIGISLTFNHQAVVMYFFSHCRVVVTGTAASGM